MKGFSPGSRLCALARRCRAAELYGNLCALARSRELRRRCPVRNDLQISHASENSKNLSRAAFGISAANLSDFFVSNQNLERRLARKQRGSIVWSDVGDQVPEAIHLQ